MSSRYDYRCVDHGDFEVCHGMKESRREMPCPDCGELMKPLISSGVEVKLTGRPAWAYNDLINAAKKSNGRISENTNVSDDIKGSKTYGKKRKIKNNMGNYKAQW